MLVKTEAGTVKGEVLTNALTSKPYYSFKGVPFAQPPIGPLRFQPPQPVNEFKDILECNDERGICPQKDILLGPDSWTGTEDCLYLNVFTNELPTKETSLKPVMVFIHGGGFTFGQKSSMIYGPDYLISKGVVLVTLNYRLNVFGFLNLEIEECKGNVGLLDQRAALIWVQKNIASFGGDPNNVTLFGESAGSASVHYHVVSPLSKGLFHKAILQSGCMFDPWAYMEPSVSVKRAFVLGKKLGCNSTCVKELYKFFLSLPMEQLRDNMYEVLHESEKSKGLSFPFVPSKETVGSYETRFLAESPEILISKVPDVPLIVGLNSKEGTIIYFDKPSVVESVLQNVDNEISKRFPSDIENLFKDQNRLQSVKEKTKDFYIGDVSDKSELASKFADFFGDLIFSRGHHKTIKTYCNLPAMNSVYTYMFSFNGGFNFVKMMTKASEYFEGASHADELGYLFCLEFFKDMLSDPKFETEKIVINNITSLWTNFAKTGNPSSGLDILWKPVNSNETSFCVINKELSIEEGFILEERMKFWDDVYHSSIDQQKL